MVKYTYITEKNPSFALDFLWHFPLNRISLPGGFGIQYLHMQYAMDYEMHTLRH